MKILQNKTKQNKTKLIVLLTMIALAIVGCEKDKISSGSEIKKPLKIRTINFKDFKKYSNNFDVQKQFSSKTAAGKNSKDSSGFQILTNKIVMYQNDSVTNYTFKLSSIDTTDVFYNLIVTLNLDNTLNNYHVLKYTPDSIWLEDKSQPFSGDVMAVHDVLGDSQIEELVLKFYACVTGYSTHWKCKAGNDHSPDDMESNGGVCEQTEFTQYFTLEWGECSGGATGSSITIPPYSYTYYNTGTGSGNGNTSIVGTQPFSTQSWEEVLDCAQNLLNVDGAVELLIDNKPLATEFESYLDGNNCSPEAQAFVELAVEALDNDGIDDGEVDFPNKVILDSTITNNQKVNCVYDKLKGLSSTVFNDIINDHFVSDKNSHLRIKITTPPNGEDAFTKGFTNNGNTFFEIQLNPNVIENASTLEIALMLIHESIHAELLDRCVQLGIINAFNSDGNPNFTNTSTTYTTYDSLFAVLVYQYKNYNGGNSQWNHDLFTVLNYRTKMAQNLVNIHPWLNDSDNDFLNNVNNDPFGVGTPYTLEQLMDYISWIGLEGTQEYSNTISNDIIELYKKVYVEEAAKQKYTHNCN